MSRRFAVSAALSVLAACGGSSVSDHIGAQARSTGVVDMIKAADFAWTQLRVYAPYTSRETVCKDLGGLAPDCLKDAPSSVPEGKYLLLFINEGKEAQYVLHSRRNGNFQTSTGVLVLQRDAAVLEVLPTKSPHQGDSIYLQARAQARP